MGVSVLPRMVAETMVTSTYSLVWDTLGRIVVNGFKRTGEGRNIKSKTLKNIHCQDRALAQWLGLLVPSTHMVVHSYLSLQFQGFQHPLLTSVDTRHKCGAYTNTQVTHT